MCLFCRSKSIEEQHIEKTLNDAGYKIDALRDKIYETSSNLTISEGKLCDMGIINKNLNNRVAELESQLQEKETLFLGSMMRKILKMIGE